MVLQPSLTVAGLSTATAVASVGSNAAALFAIDPDTQHIVLTSTVTVTVTVTVQLTIAAAGGISNRVSDLYVRAVLRPWIVIGQR
ncbi:hypothetical protein KO481_34925 [Nocardia sp. NEAU-G5]|uniref:Uncharacterized protein n=1 Tax=Nocardia albiluteola TaxID=2842303 RepID=A0ABS6B8S7_9NOCA|nr:hypothetical protein [Nocardia albiluteola]MBU3066697.1 hypothetical protein [Nocardia albiluteola]